MREPEAIEGTFPRKPRVLTKVCSSQQQIVGLKVRSVQECTWFNEETRLRQSKNPRETERIGVRSQTDLNDSPL